jgi:hypothetical protein
LVNFSKPKRVTAVPFYVEAKNNNARQRQTLSPTGGQARCQSKIISDAPAFCHFQQCPAESKKIAGNQREKPVTGSRFDFSGWEIAAKGQCNRNSCNAHSIVGGFD